LYFLSFFCEKKIFNKNFGGLEKNLKKKYHQNKVSFSPKISKKQVLWIENKMTIKTHNNKEFFFSSS
jgi:hypothetical protein